MSSRYTYQNIDTSEVKQMINDDQKSVNGLDLVVEEDVSPKLPKAKKNIIQQDSAIIVVDTFYGIKNEALIPIRKPKLPKILEKGEQQLFNPELCQVDLLAWQTIILLISVFLLGFAKAFSNNRFRQSIKALVNYSVAQEINREEKVFFHRANIFLTIIHALTTSLFIYQLKGVFQSRIDQPPSFIFFLIIIGAVLSIYTIKYLFSKILFFVFNNISISSEYIFNTSLFNNLLGILLIPVLALTYYTTIDYYLILKYMVIPLVGLMLLLKIIRLFTIGTAKGISYFYIFLYICTLEILPLVVLYGIFILK